MILDIKQFAYVFVATIIGILPIILTYVFGVSVHVFLGEKINNLINSEKKIRTEIKKLENKDRRDIITVTLTIYILIFTSATLMSTCAIGSTNNSTTDSIIQSIIQENSKNVEVIYLISIAFLIMCFLGTLFAPYKSNDRLNDLQEKINCYLFFNLILIIFSIFLLILLPLCLYYVILLYQLLSIDRLQVNMLQPLQRVVFDLTVHFLNILTYVSIGLVFVNCVMIVIAAYNSLCLAYLSLTQNE